MKQTLFLKMSEEISKDFSSLMATAIMQKTLESLKTAEDTGVFKFVISTDDEDRQGEKVNQAGLDFGMYMKNPVVLWGHNYGEPPVGVATRVWRDGNKTMAEGKWAPTAFAQELRKLYDAGILRACSIGYIPKELDDDGNTQKGEVLEFSIVSIPANPFALSSHSMKEYKFDLNMLASKGIDFKLETEIKHTSPAVKTGQAGDTCQLEDGGEGKFGDDGKGGLICQPIKDAGAESGKEKELKEVKVQEGEDEADDLENGAVDALLQELTGEVDRHDGASTKSIEEFCKSIEGFHKGKKDAGDGDMPEEMTKAIAAFRSAMVDEHTGHREKCMKALEEYTNTQKAAKLAAIKGAVQQELEQTDEWKAKYTKLDRVYDIFYAFTNAYMDETTPVDDFEKLLDEAVALMKDQGSEAKGLLKKHFVAGAQKKFSKTNLETMKGALAEFEKAMASHDTASSSMADVHKSHKAVYAALKDLVSGSNEGGDGGGEGDKDAAEPAPKIKVDKTSAANAEQKDLESFLLNRDLLKSLAKGIDGALEKWNETHGKQRPASRK